MVKNTDPSASNPGSAPAVPFTSQQLTLQPWASDFSSVQWDHRRSPKD